MEWQARIEEKIDKISDKIEVINITLVKQESNLQEHMRRTEAAEASLIILREEFKPIQRHVTRIEGVIKLIGIVSIAVSIVAGLIEVIKFFK